MLIDADIVDDFDLENCYSDKSNHVILATNSYPIVAGSPFLDFYLGQ